MCGPHLDPNGRCGRRISDAWAVNHSAVLFEGSVQKRLDLCFMEIQNWTIGQLLCVKYGLAPLPLFDGTEPDFILDSQCTW